MKAMRLENIPSPKEIRAFYDARAQNPRFQAEMYDTRHRKDTEARQKRLLEVILPFAPRVLELGCADGLLSAWLSPRVEYLAGVEIAKPCVERCEALNLPNARFYHGELHEQPLWADFDLALALDVLEHLPKPERALSWLSYWAGRVLASVPINENPNPDAFSVEAHLNPRKIGDGSGHIWSFRSDTFKALFDEIWHYEDNGITAIILGRA